ncbi:MAG: 30S ribosomal protein S3ae [Candidatus Bathyarchaeia archaeon]
MSSRKSARLRDKWRLKTWYSIHASDYFGGTEVGTIPAGEKSTIVGRIIESTLYDITRQDISQMNVKTYFQILSTEGNRAEAVFKGHEYSREYLRSLVRRGSSRVDSSYNVDTKDQYKLRVHSVAFSRRRLNPSQETALRSIMGEILLEKAKNLNFNQLVQELVLGKLASEIHNKATKLAPLRHVGIRKSKLLELPDSKLESKTIEPEVKAETAQA